MDAFDAWTQVSVDLLNLRVASSISEFQVSQGCAVSVPPVCRAPGGRGEKTSVTREIPESVIITSTQQSR